MTVPLSLSNNIVIVDDGNLLLCLLLHSISFALSSSPFSLLFLVIIVWCLISLLILSYLSLIIAYTTG